MTHQQSVRDFMIKHGHPVRQPFSASKVGLNTIENVLVDAEEHASLFVKYNLECARLHLMIEELREISQAMHKDDRVGLADGLADLLYIIYGTAEAFDIPLDTCFREVHRSNMTKDAGIGVHKPIKGANFQHPNLEQYL